VSRIDDDAGKLRFLADWFDEQDRKSGARSTGDEVQQDLRRIAGYLSTHVVVGPNRYKRLIEDQDKLNALEQYGVDNWVGYDDAMRELRAADTDDD
jgi:hypothetical protein